MTPETPTTALADLEAFPYINAEGKLPDHVQGKVGIYAIFDQANTLQYVGYSRDVYLSLKQHLVRQPNHCYWVKVQTIDRPSRTILEAIQAAWIAENGSTPIGNSTDAALWNQPIDAKQTMTTAEQQHYAQVDELGQVKALKNVARRVEAEILAVLQQRGVTVDLRFNPKLKEEGLLDLK